MVDWIKRIPGETSEEPPPSVFSDLEMQNLGILRPRRTVALGDVRMYKMKPHDGDLLLKEDFWQTYLRRRLGIFRPRSALNSLMGIGKDRFAITKDELVPVEVVYLKSTAEVAWVVSILADTVDSRIRRIPVDPLLQDGTISHMDTTKICRVHSTYFEVGEVVKPKELPLAECATKYGIVQQIRMGKIN